MVSIIIPSYNTKDLLISCLSSIIRSFPKNEYEIIIVDNASEDNSVHDIKKTFPNLVVIENKKNTGFAHAINQGVKQANGEYLLFLNSDTEVKDNFLEKIPDIFEKDKTIGVIGIQLRDNNRQIEKSYGSFYTYWSLFTLLFFPQNTSVTQDVKEVEWVSGGCFFTRREVFEKLQGFDERIFMYVEDVEICYRIKKLGYKILYLPMFSVLHKGQGSSNRTFAITQIYKGIVYFYRKHKPEGFWYAKLLLEMKAKLSIGIGRIMHDTYLQDTYREALKQL